MSDPKQPPEKREISISEMRSMSDPEKREVVRQAIQDLLDDPLIPEDAKRCIRGEVPFDPGDDDSGIEL